MYLPEQNKKLRNIKTGVTVFAALMVLWSAHLAVSAETMFGTVWHLALLVANAYLFVRMMPAKFKPRINRVLQPIRRRSAARNNAKVHKL